MSNDVVNSVKIKDVAVTDKSIVFKSKGLALGYTMPRLSLAAQRVIMAMLTMIDPDDPANTEYIIHGSDLARITGYNNNKMGQDLKRIHESDELRTCKIHIDEKDGDLNVGWVQSTKYMKGSGDLRINVSSDLMPYLCSMIKKHHTFYEVGGPIRFISEYSFPLFDHLGIYANQGPQLILVEDMRQYLGVEDGKFARVYDLERVIIKRAINDINNCSDLIVEYWPYKVGRAIKGFYFDTKFKADSIREEMSSKLEQEDNEEKPEEMTLFDDDKIPHDPEKLIEILSGSKYHMNENVVRNFIKKHGIEQVYSNFSYVVKNCKPKNYASYIYWAITNNIYGKMQFEQKLSEKQKEENKKKIIALEKEYEKEQKKILDSYKCAYNATDFNSFTKAINKMKYDSNFIDATYTEINEEQNKTEIVESAELNMKSNNPEKQDTTANDILTSEEIQTILSTISDAKMREKLTKVYSAHLSRK